MSGNGKGQLACAGCFYFGDEDRRRAGVCDINACYDKGQIS